MTRTTAARATTPAALVILLLAGCVSTATADTASSTPSPSASATPVPVEATADAPPAVFEGDCTRIASASEIGAIVGETVTPMLLSPRRAGRAVIALGGLECAWNGVDEIAASVTIIPTAAAGAHAIDKDPYCYEVTGVDVRDACSFDVGLGDYWFSGIFWTRAGAEVTAEGATSAFEALVAPRTDEPAPALSAIPNESWDRSLDCTAIDDTADLATVLGAPALEVSPGNGPAEVPDGTIAALGLSGSRSCMWIDPGGLFFEVEFLPVGAWAVDAAATDGRGTDVAVEGAERAVVVPGSDGLPDELFATDGTNLIVAMIPSNLAAIAPIIGPLLAAPPS
jgi:hypothetical protein